MDISHERYFRRFLKPICPALEPADFEITSPATEDYNCFAWAVGINNQKWDPRNKSSWPFEDVSHGEPTLDRFLPIFSKFGFEPLPVADWEERSIVKPGYEKIAIYQSVNNKVLHAARLLPSGRWASKLGNLVDIEHNSLECLAGSLYGSPALILIRKI